LDLTSLLLQFHINSNNPISQVLPYPQINCPTLPAAMFPNSLTRLPVRVQEGMLAVVIDTTVSVNANRVCRLSLLIRFFTTINAGGLGSVGGDCEEGCDPVHTGKNVSTFRRNLLVHSSQLEMNFYLVKILLFIAFIRRRIFCLTFCYPKI
jgi:hypothetical protein